MLHVADFAALGLIAVLAIIFRRGLVGDGYGYDREFAAMFMGAQNGETMSVMFERAQAAGKAYGCMACWVLGEMWTPWGRGFVEPDHCARAAQLDGVPTAANAGYRAGVLLLVLRLLTWALPWAVGRLG